MKLSEHMQRAVSLMEGEVRAKRFSVPGALRYVAEAALQERSEATQSWIPVHERLPEASYNGIRSHDVFVRSRKGIFQCQAAYEGGKFHSWCDPEWREITHWMPIPELPERATSARNIEEPK